MSVEAGYTTRHADKHRNLVGSQQPMAQTSPAGQSSWERQPAAVAQSGPSDCTQTPPPPIFFEQKHVPWHPPPPRSRLQVNGSRHLSTQRLRAQTPPLGQSRLRVQDWAAACCAPSPRTVHSVLPSSPPSSRRRGTMPVVPRDVGPVVCVLRGRPPSINPMNAQPGSDFVFLSIEEGRDDHFSRPQSRLVRQERGHPGPYSWHEALVHLEPSVPSPPAVVPGRSCSRAKDCPTVGCRVHPTPSSHSRRNRLALLCDSIVTRAMPSATADRLGAGHVFHGLLGQASEPAPWDRDRRRSACGLGLRKSG
jgi:hypothetical protein